MKRHLAILAIAASLCSGPVFAQEFSLKTVKEAPQGLPQKIAGKVDSAGHQVVGGDGPVATVWFAKSIDAKADFKPTFDVKYPFTVGQLVGALKVAEGASFTDFRGQEVQPGVYTLRYGQQPVDGNHVGTSEFQDFLLAIPAEQDADPEPISDLKKLTGQSAKAIGGTHPAIFALRPGEDVNTPKLSHEAGEDLWILHASAAGKDKPIPVHLVVVGFTSG